MCVISKVPQSPIDVLFIQNGLFLLVSVLSQHRWKRVHFELTTMIEVLWQKSVRFSRRLDWEAAEMSHFCIKSKELPCVPVIVVVVFDLIIIKMLIRMVLVDEHNSALPYSHAEWAHSNLGHYQVAAV